MSKKLTKRLIKRASQPLKSEAGKPARKMACTICGDEIEFGKLHAHNPKGKPIESPKF